MRRYDATDDGRDPRGIAWGPRSGDAEEWARRDGRVTAHDLAAAAAELVVTEVVETEASVAVLADASNQA